MKYTHTHAFVHQHRLSFTPTHLSLCSSSQAQSVLTHSPFPRLRLPARVALRVHLSAHKVLLISQPQTAIITPHLGSPWQPGPQPRARGPEGCTGDGGPRDVASASLIRATWRQERLTLPAFQSSTPRPKHRGTGRECVWLLRPPALPF